MVLGGAGRVTRRVAGVAIGGVEWKIGYHCLYHEGPDGVTLAGKVINMFQGKDDMMDEFVLFEIKNMPITSYMGHYCLLSQNEDPAQGKFIMWSQVAWKGKVLLLGNNSRMLLPFKSCTSQELIEFRT